MADNEVAFRPWSAGGWERAKRHAIYRNDEEDAQFIKWLRESES